VNDILLRAELHTPEQGHQALASYAWPWAKEQLRQGRELVAEFRLLEDDITDKQRAYLHGVVFKEIAMYARPGGQQFDKDTWKEHFRKEWLGFKTVSNVNPMTGKRTRTRVRQSTEDLGIRAMAEYIDRVIAFAATELGVTVSEPLPPELRPGRRKPTAKDIADQETGEILEGATA
jgi:hypothetical protein